MSGLRNVGRAKRTDEEVYEVLCNSKYFLYDSMNETDSDINGLQAMHRLGTVSSAANRRN